MMDDRAVIEAFVAGDPSATGRTLHVERDILYRDGWWHAAFRLAERAFLVRPEPPPDGADVAADVVAALTEQGLRLVSADHPLIDAVTYTELAVTAVAWELWADSAETGEAALIALAATESVPVLWDEHAQPAAPADTATVT